MAVDPVHRSPYAKAQGVDIQDSTAAGTRSIEVIDFPVCKEASARYALHPSISRQCSQTIQSFVQGFSSSPRHRETRDFPHPSLKAGPLHACHGNADRLD